MATDGTPLMLDLQYRVAQNGVPFLGKPFRIQELIESVEYLFNRNQQQGS